MPRDWKNRKQWLKQYRKLPHRKEKLRQYFLKYRQRNRNKTNKTSREYRAKLKTAAFNAYGGCTCMWCKEIDFTVLSIDHINNNGRNHKDRAGHKCCGNRIYSWLKINNYPVGFQVLCFNCNYAKAANKGTLPPNRYNLHLRSINESIEYYI